MTDHIRDSIDQIFPPEPPDDPAPEPVPPADDALPPCPVCGGNNLIAAYYSWSMRHFIRCNGCHIDFAVSMTPPVARSTYQRLARAVALLRAVEQAHTMMHARLTRLNVFINDAGDTVIEVIGEDDDQEIFLMSPDPVGRTIADALIALAARVERRSEGE